ncbi:hypothetical protein SAMN04488063_1114 [Halopelagius inordinatus]|uniref:Uncharacterized protein n=2 Tax=Halopelagius inordinatus TaxID=553467 RepID=A0A1I2NAC5_9EURY|nr:hypothetical protein SAMN04488063_1114 [Halopelagius inordinatus]
MENYTLGHLREEDVQMFTLRTGYAITGGTCSLLGAQPAANTTLPFRGIGATKGSYVPKKAK